MKPRSVACLATGRMACGAASRILVIDDAATVPESGRYDFILLPGSLESADDPTALLGHARSLLVERGEIIVTLGNAASSCFTVFGGRHWDGYQNPGVRQQLTPKPCSASRQVPDCELQDSRPGSRAGAGCARRATGCRTGALAGRLSACSPARWILPQLAAMLLEAQALARGRGASLGAVLVLP